MLFLFIVVSPPRANVIHAHSNRRIEGPFGETKELIGGFAIFELASKQEAIEYANRFVDAHVKCGVSEFEMDIRPMFGPEDSACPNVAAE